jgi:hypothetical protein
MTDNFTTTNGSRKVVTTANKDDNGNIKSYYSVLFVDYGNICTTKTAKATTRKGAQKQANKMLGIE